MRRFTSHFLLLHRYQPPNVWCFRSRTREQATATHSQSSSITRVTSLHIAGSKLSMACRKLHIEMDGKRPTTGVAWIHFLRIFDRCRWKLLLFWSPIHDTTSTSSSCCVWLSICQAYVYHVSEANEMENYLALTLSLWIETLYFAGVYFFFLKIVSISVFASQNLFAWIQV